MTTVSHTWTYGRLIEYRASSGERNFMERIKAQIFLEAVLATDNVRAPIQFRRESQPKHLKRLFFPQEQTHPFSHQ